jgi:hypothetical protein
VLRYVVTPAGLFLLGHLACLRVNVAVCTLLYSPLPPGGNRILPPPRISGPGRLFRLTVAGRGRIILGDNRSPAIPAWCQTVRFNLNSPAGQMAAVTSSEPSQKSCLPKMSDDRPQRRLAKLVPRVCPGNNCLGKPLKGENLLLTNRNSAAVWWSDIGQAARRCGIFSRWLSA